MAACVADLKFDAVRAGFRGCGKKGNGKGNNNDNRNDNRNSNSNSNGNGNDNSNSNSNSNGNRRKASLRQSGSAFGAAFIGRAEALPFRFERLLAGVRKELICGDWRRPRLSSLHFPHLA